MAISSSSIFCSISTTVCAAKLTGDRVAGVLGNFSQLWPHFRPVVAWVHGVFEEIRAVVL